MTIPGNLSARIKHSALVLLLCCGSIWSLRLLQAELQTLSVRQQLERWSAAGQVSSLNNWEAQQSNLERARSLQPRQEDNHRLNGLLQEWRGHRIANHTNTAEETLTSHRAAVQAYRSAVRQRPALPNAWAHLARLKLLAGEPDAEFRQAVARALALGPHIEEVQLELLYIAALAWATLTRDPALAEALPLVLRDALVTGRNTARKLQLLQAGGQLPLLCGELELTAADMPALLQRSCSR